jgi:hypothetical protein
MLAADNDPGPTDPPCRHLALRLPPSHGLLPAVLAGCGNCPSRAASPNAERPASRQPGADSRAVACPLPRILAHQDHLQSTDQLTRYSRNLGSDSSDQHPNGEVPSRPTCHGGRYPVCTFVLNFLLALIMRYRIVLRSNRQDRPSQGTRGRCCRPPDSSSCLQEQRQLSGWCRRAQANMTGEGTLRGREVAFR